MLIGSISAALATFFAALAAVAALISILQARALHKADANDRDHDRRERRVEFELESEERRQVVADDRSARQLEQLGRISDLVANVRETARREAAPDGRLSAGAVLIGATPADRAVFFWNTRRQLDLGLAAFRALGGADDLTACHELATGSSMVYLQDVVSRSTDAFDELARAAARRADDPT